MASWALRRQRPKAPNRQVTPDPACSSNIVTSEVIESLRQDSPELFETFNQVLREQRRKRLG